MLKIYLLFFNFIFNKKNLDNYNPLVKLDQGDSFNPNQYCVNNSLDLCFKCKMSYLEDDLCRLPAKKIVGCLEYDSETVCKECQFGLGVVDGKC